MLAADVGGGASLALFRHKHGRVEPNFPFKYLMTPTREFGDLNGVGVALQTKPSQALAAVLVRQVEVPHQVLGGRLVHIQLVSILLVEETHFLQNQRHNRSR